MLRGDAPSLDDVSCAFTSAQKRFGCIDAVLFGIGGRLVFSGNPFAQSALSPSSVCERTIRNLTDALTALEQPEQPRLVVISSNGLAKQGCSLLPYLMRPLYAFLLHAPRGDTERMESHLHALAGWPSDALNPLHREQLRRRPRSSVSPSCVPLCSSTALRSAASAQRICSGTAIPFADPMSAYSSTTVFWEDRKIGANTWERLSQWHTCALSILPQYPSCPTSTLCITTITICCICSFLITCSAS